MCLLYKYEKKANLNKCMRVSFTIHVFLFVGLLILFVLMFRVYKYVCFCIAEMLGKSRKVPWTEY